MNNSSRKNLSVVVIHVLLSFLAVGAVNVYMFGEVPTDFTNGLVSALMFAAFLVLGRKNPDSGKEADTPKTRLTVTNIALCAAIFTAVAFGIGTSMYHTNSLEPIIGSFAVFLRSVLYTAGAAYVLFLLYCRVMCWFRDFSVQTPAKNEWKFFGGNWQSFLVGWGVIFAAWFPVFLAYFPGTFSYDANRLLYQIEDFARLNNFYSILHTFFMSITWNIGGSNQYGVMVYSIAQMLLLSAAFAYVVYYLARLKLPYPIRVIALAWFALSPFNAIFALVINQDVWIAGVLAIILVLTIELVKNPDEFFCSGVKIIRLTVFLVMFALLRNNAIYALFAAAIVMPPVLRTHRKQVFKLLGIAVIIAWFLTTPVVTLFGWDANEPREALSVPAQQIAYVASNHFHEFSEEEHELVMRIWGFNPGDAYNPRLSDPVKDHISADETGYFMRLWLALLPQYPLEFTEAFLTLNLPLWFPDAAYPDHYSQRRYIEEWIYYGFEIERRPILPALLEWYEAFARNESALQRLPVARTLTSVGTPIWVMFALFLLLLAKKNQKKWIYATVLLLPFAHWATFMFGPVSNVRYMYPLIAAYPIFLAIAAIAGTEED